jgi:hypothetical protein
MSDSSFTRRLRARTKARREQASQRAITYLLLTNLRTPRDLWKPKPRSVTSFADFAESRD